MTPRGLSGFTGGLSLVSGTLRVMGAKTIEELSPNTQEWLRVLGGLVEWGTLPAQREALWVDIMVAAIDGHPNKELANEAVAALQAKAEGR